MRTIWLLCCGVAVVAIASVYVYRPTHTVSWFMQHGPERTATVDRCADNPGDGRHDPNCTNAIRAADRKSVDDFADQQIARAWGKR